MKSFDVVIIGAGLAGLQCAKLLSQKGAKILLVDRKTDLTKGVHTTGIFVRKTLEDFDFPAGTLGAAVRCVTLYSPKLKSVDLKSEKEEFRVGKMGVLYESMLGECTANGVEFSSGTRYVKSEPLAVASGSGTSVKLEKNGTAFEVGAKVLIGADGAASRVARDLGLDENREWIVGYEEVYRAEKADGEPRLHCFLDAELAPGYLAWIADDGEEIHIGVGGYAAQFDPREALKSFKGKTKRLFDLKDAKLAETRGGRIPVGGVPRRIASECGLLIGDAAGAVSPLTAGGLDPAMRLSKLAAEIVRERLRRDDPKILLRYSGELFRARFVSRLWMRRLIKTFTNQRLLEFGFAFLRGGIGQKFARHVFFGRGSFPDVEIQKPALGSYRKSEI
ncbi:MAG TPA: NAD(P)/FAD-dependent oxidoreductase [Pyrinomonadaceae bacterium]|jgi:flavin-dependent dehydrogenase